MRGNTTDSPPRLILYSSKFSFRFTPCAFCAWVSSSTFKVINGFCSFGEVDTISLFTGVLLSSELCSDVLTRSCLSKARFLPPIPIPIFLKLFSGFFTDAATFFTGDLSNFMLFAVDFEDFKVVFALPLANFPFNKSHCFLLGTIGKFLVKFGFCDVDLSLK